MYVLLIISVFVILIAICSGFFMLWNLPYIARSKGEKGRFPTISIIIPVRNEEDNIPHLLDSLFAQSLKPKEIIVVDDDSTDRTVEILSRYDVEIKQRDQAIDDPQLVGKTAACSRGARDATGEWLMFIDADTTFDHENSLESICQSFQEKGSSGLFTIQPYHRPKRLYEHFSAPLNMIVVAGLNAFTPLKERFKTGGAFGPFLMCSSKEYEQTGGHEKTLDFYMDNIELAKVFQTNNLPIHNYGGRGVFSYRMYPEGPKQWLLGWSKSVANGSSNTHPSVMLAISLWITGGYIAAILLMMTFWITSPIWIGISVFMYVCYACQFIWLAGKVGKFPSWLFLIYPVVLSAFLVVFTWSYIQVNVLHAVSWRDRKIDV